MRSKVVATFAAALVLLAIAYVFATGGVPSRQAVEWLDEQPIAHRGLWSTGPQRPENSLAAFDAAVARGYAVELDVQRSGDGVTVVIHDEELERMTGAPGAVADAGLSGLKERRLLGGAERIPTLKEALERVDGRVPLLVEIKNEGEVGALEDDVAQQLAGYDGPVAVMSFNPFSLARVAESAPEIARGQLSGSFEGEDLAAYEVFLLRNLLMNWKSRPDFIAYEFDQTPSLTTTLQRRRGRPLVGWTAETPEERAQAETRCDAVICDPAALE